MRSPCIGALAHRRICKKAIWFLLPLLFVLASSTGLGLTLEAENMSPTGTGQSITSGSDPAASGGEWLKIASTAVGQWIQFTTPAIPAGTYQFNLIYRSNPTRAQDDITLDGVKIGSTIDQYAPSPSLYPDVMVATVNFPADGAHTIRLTATGKNASSTGYEISADAFIFTPQSGGAQVAAPAFNPSDGNYATPPNVVISTSTAGASIRFTTDGSLPGPTNGTLYSAPLTINSSVTLNAIAYSDGMTSSSISSATYAVAPVAGNYSLPPGVPIFVDGSEAGPIVLAIADLQRDLQKVLGAPSPIVNVEPSSGPAIVVTCKGAGTSVYRDGSLTSLESHELTAQGTADTPRIVLQGADTRGTIYAIYEFSDRFLNVPPLWYWASWTIPMQTSILVPADLNVRINSPAVRYRGWFPNDTDMLSPWLNASTNNYHAFFETLLRLKYNLLDVDHISDVGGANTGLIWARTCRDRGIVVTFTHYAALGADIGEYGAIVGGSPNANNLVGLQQFWTHYVNLAINNNLTEVIEPIVFRGHGDQAWWNAISGDPGTSQGRANIICQMMTNEMTLLRSMTGNPHPLMRTVFYSEVGDFMDHYNTPGGFNMNPPTDPDLIWCPSSDQRDHYPTPDVTSYNYLSYQSGHNPFGYYFNFQFYTTGSHVVAGEGPWKAALNHQIVFQNAGPGNFVCSVLNAGNVREFTMELAAGGDLLWNLAPGYDPNVFLTNFCARYFGAANAPQVAALAAAYYNAFWAQEKPDTVTFPGGFPRQFIFQDLRYARAAEALLADLASRSFIANPFDTQGPRYFRVIPAVSGAAEELHATINGTAVALSNFNSVVASAESIYANLASDRQPYFNDLLRQPAQFMLQCNLFLQGLSVADSQISNGNAAVYPWLARAQSASAAMSQTLSKSTQGPIFSGWYGAESKFNVPNLQNLVNSVIGRYPAAQPYFQSATATSTQAIFGGAGGLSNGTYSILASTNLSLSATNWTIWGSNLFDSAGSFNFTSPIVSNLPGQFFLLRTP